MGRARAARLALLLVGTMGIAAASLSSCSRRGGEGAPPAAEREGSRQVDEPRPIETVLSDSTATWMEIEGVEGTGLGTCDGEPCIVVYVARRTPEVEARIPDSAEGHRIRIEVTGRFRPLEAEEPSG